LLPTTASIDVVNVVVSIAIVVINQLNATTNQRLR
jgi:hypothetical protein